MTSKLSIIIPTHNRHDSLLRLLQSINRQEIDFSLFEVIVVTNLFDSTLEDILKTANYHYALKIESSHNMGANAARNKGIAAARFDYLLFLDDDVEILNRSYLSSIINLSWDDKLAAIGGGYLLGKTASIFETVYHQIAMGWLNNQDHSQERSLLLGGNTIYNRRLLKGKLHFDEKIQFGGTETELNMRLLQEGYKLRFDSRLNVLHHCSLTFILFIKKAYYQGRGKQRINDSFTITRFSLEHKTLFSHFLHAIYEDVFYFGICVEERNVKKIIHFILKWRVGFSLISLSFILVSLFFPLPLMGLSVIYIDIWDRLIGEDP